MHYLCRLLKHIIVNCRCYRFVFDSAVSLVFFMDSTSPTSPTSQFYCQYSSPIQWNEWLNEACESIQMNHSNEPTRSNRTSAESRAQKAASVVESDSPSLGLRPTPGIFHTTQLLYTLLGFNVVQKSFSGLMQKNEKQWIRETANLWHKHLFLHFTLIDE